jgi:hypothetical protein
LHISLAKNMEALFNVIASVLQADQVIGHNILETTPLMERMVDDWCSSQPVEGHERFNWKVIHCHACMPPSHSPSGWLLKIRLSDVVLVVLLSARRTASSPCIGINKTSCCNEAADLCLGTKHCHWGHRTSRTMCSTLRSNASAFSSPK